MTQAVPRLAIQGLSKSFGPHAVLSGVDLTVGPGEIHGLAGQNGSGKSTLIKLLTGVHAPDPGGSVQVDGSPLAAPVRWRHAHEAGLRVVHQDLGLLDHLSVAENVCVGGFPTTRGGRIDRRARDRLAGATLRRLDVDIDVAVPVAELSAAPRAEVAIARALRDHTTGGGLVILDESTRALRGGDLDRIHQLMRRMASSGTSFVLISHSLAELENLADAVTVLRDGRVAARLRGAEISQQAVARAMLGAAVPTFHRLSDGSGRDVARVRVRGLTGRGVAGVNFDVARGEVVGITGMPGGGHETIPALLSGQSPASAGGVVDIDGRRLDLSTSSIASALRAGVMLVPERRDRDGLAMGMSVQDNIVLPRLRGRRRPLYLSRSWRRSQGRLAVREHDIRPAEPLSLVRQLSGGNQQKALLAKWMSMNPRFLILHEPTQAVDVGARLEILRKITELADEGVAVLVVSSEADDLTAICDRVLVHQADGGLVAGSSTDSDLLLQQVFTPPHRTTEMPKEPR